MYKLCILLSSEEILFSIKYFRYFIIAEVFSSFLGFVILLFKLKSSLSIVHIIAWIIFSIEISLNFCFIKSIDSFGLYLKNA